MSRKESISYGEMLDMVDDAAEEGIDNILKELDSFRALCTLAICMSKLMAHISDDSSTDDNIDNISTFIKNITHTFIDNIPKEDSIIN